MPTFCHSLYHSLLSAFELVSIIHEMALNLEALKGAKPLKKVKAADLHDASAPKTHTDATTASAVLLIILSCFFASIVIYIYIYICPSESMGRVSCFRFVGPSTFSDKAPAFSICYSFDINRF